MASKDISIVSVQLLQMTRFSDKSENDVRNWQRTGRLTMFRGRFPFFPLGTCAAQLQKLQYQQIGTGPTLVETPRQCRMRIELDHVNALFLTFKIQEMYANRLFIF